MDDFEAEISTIRDRALLWMADKLKSDQAEQARVLWAAKGKQAFEADPATPKEKALTIPTVGR